MTGETNVRRWGVLGLLMLYVLRIDLWFWRDATLIAGIPVGLAYHVVFCFLASAWFWWMVSRQWPERLDEAERRAARTGGEA